MSDIPDRIHRTLIEKIVKGLSDKPLVLKGGTALMLAYNLDRYSEDIDYDSSTKIDLPGHLEAIMQGTRMQYNSPDGTRSGSFPSSLTLPTTRHSSGARESGQQLPTTKSPAQLLRSSASSSVT